MIITAIEAQMNNLRPSERLVANYVLGRPSVVVHMSIADLADNIHVSEPTIMRFCKALGCTGFMEFKLALARDLERRTFQRNRSNPAVKGPTGFGQAVFSRTLANLEESSKQLALDRIDEILEYCAASRAVTVIHSGSEEKLATLLVDALVICRIDANSQTHAQITGRLDGRLVIGLRTSQTLTDFAQLCADTNEMGGKVVVIGFEGSNACVSFPLVANPAEALPARGDSLHDDLLYLTLVEALRAGIAARLSRTGAFSDTDADVIQSQREIAYGDARRRDRQTATANDALAEQLLNNQLVTREVEENA